MYLNQTMDAARRVDRKALYTLAHDIFIAWQEGRTVYTCGNGGSAASASHLAQDLGKGTLVPGAQPLRCICLCDSVPSLTAWANDEGYALALGEYLRTLGRQGDLLIAISGSGNSPNVLYAVDVAHELEMHTWGVTGFDGGALIETAHRCVHVPLGNMGMVEAVHGILFHWLVDYLHGAFVASAHHRLDELVTWVPHP
jgi:D-sedoheptulose 7-phosphate isomerase